MRVRMCFMVRKGYSVCLFLAAWQLFAQPAEIRIQPLSTAPVIDGNVTIEPKSMESVRDPS